MLTSLARTAVLLFFAAVLLRVMGKRQIGELQPGELVVTILLSQIAATPMQDSDIPLLHTLVCIFTLTGAEVLLSALAMKSVRLRTLVDGSSVQVIRDGKIDQQALRRLRYTLDDLLEGLRQKDVFDVSEVHSAVVETNGALSVLLKAPKRPATVELLRKNAQEAGPPRVLVADGRLDPAGMRAAGADKPQVLQLLRERGASPETTFLLTLDGAGGVYFVKKEG